MVHRNYIGSKWFVFLKTVFRKIDNTKKMFSKNKVYGNTDNTKNEDEDSLFTKKSSECFCFGFSGKKLIRIC